MEQTKYDVFISYSRRDYVDEHKNVIPGNEVSKIKEALSSAGISFWMDEKGIIPGEDYAAKITKYIKACKIFLYISSENANQSDWTRKEIATALMYKKYIVPLLLDDSPFHDSVILRIADLDRIDYYVNPQQGLEILVRTINTCLEKLAAEEKRKQEEAERKKDLERRKAEELKQRQELEAQRHRQEQEELIKSIRLENEVLNANETKLMAERKTLLLRSQWISDPEKKTTLQNEIKDGSPIAGKLREEIEALQQEHKNVVASYIARIEEIEVQRDSAEEMRDQVERELSLTKTRFDDEIRQKTEQIRLLEDNLKNASKATPSKKTHIAYISAIFAILLGPLIWVVNDTHKIQDLQDKNMKLEVQSSVDNAALKLLDNKLRGRFTVNGVDFTMIPVEGGKFKMGAQKTDSSGDNYDPDAENNESPVHEVTLSDFYIGETEVTQALWEQVMGFSALPHCHYNEPVYGISWREICGTDGKGTDPNCFIYNLNKLTGRHFRLPTEAEWEYAARGGNKCHGYNYSGNDDIDKVAWYKENSIKVSSENQSYYKIRPVKQKAANEIGLFDMCGNVSEWCQDRLGTYSNETQKNPTGPSSGDKRVTRGGDYLSNAKDCRVTERKWHDQDSHNGDIGFRLALDLK